MRESRMEMDKETWYGGCFRSKIKISIRIRRTDRIRIMRPGMEEVSDQRKQKQGGDIVSVRGRKVEMRITFSPLSEGR